MATLGAKAGRGEEGKGVKPTKSLEHWLDFERGTERDKVGVAKSWWYKESWRFKMAAAPSSLLKVIVFNLKKNGGKHLETFLHRAAAPSASLSEQTWPRGRHSNPGGIAFPTAPPV